MAEKLNLYRCDICGNIVEVVIDGAGILVCCGEDMKLIESSSNENMGEKHVPVVENMGTTHVVKVGQVPHPMLDEHYIQFIEIISNDNRYIKRKYLHPDEEPEMVIKCMNSDDFEAREYCNIHGLYTNKEKNNG